jgi:YD repeat-containing protein
MEHRTGNSLTEFAYDFRGRRVGAIRHVRSGETLETNWTFVSNQLFSTEDPYGRKTYFAYDATDGRLIRTVKGAVPSFSLVDYAAVLNLTRDASANADYVVTDRVHDAVGNLVESFDSRLIETEFVYDSRGRQTVMISAVGTTVEARTETDYDAASNVVEVRSPRWFDSSDAGGYEKARETWTYTDRNLVATHTEAPGTAEGATESFEYDLKGRQIEHEDFQGKTWYTHYEDCCGQTIANENPLGHGSLSRKDAVGQVVHQVTFEDYSSHTMSLDNPVDSKTLREVTTRYDGRGRPVARTTWLVPLGSVDLLDPPIAGFDSVSASDGLTTQYLYDDDLTDNDGLDSSGGMSYTKLADTGSGSVSLSGALTKLAATEANGGAGISFEQLTPPAAARVSINGEDEVRFTIADAAGRTVMSGSWITHDGSSPNSLLTWNCTLHDTVTTLVSNYGDCLESPSASTLSARSTSQLTDAAGRTLRSNRPVGQSHRPTRMTPRATSCRSATRTVSARTVTYDALNRDLDMHRYGKRHDQTARTTWRAIAISTTDAKSNTTTYTLRRPRPPEQSRPTGSAARPRSPTRPPGQLASADRRGEPE